MLLHFFLQVLVFARYCLICLVDFKCFLDLILKLSDLRFQLLILLDKCLFLLLQLIMQLLVRFLHHLLGLVVSLLELLFHFLDDLFFLLIDWIMIRYILNLWLKRFDFLFQHFWFSQSLLFLAFHFLLEMFVFRVQLFIFFVELVQPLLDMAVFMQIIFAIHSLRKMLWLLAEVGHGWSSNQLMYLSLFIGQMHIELNNLSILLIASHLHVLNLFSHFSNFCAKRSCCQSYVIDVRIRSLILMIWSWKRSGQADLFCFIFCLIFLCDLVWNDLVDQMGIHHPFKHFIHTL